MWKKIPLKIKIWFPVVLLDAFWAWGALRSENLGDQLSIVDMLNLIIWSFFHLPAMLLGGWILSMHGSLDLEQSMNQLSMGAYMLLGGLGLIQTAVTGWMIFLWLDRRAARRRARDTKLSQQETQSRDHAG